MYTHTHVRHKTHLEAHKYCTLEISYKEYQLSLISKSSTITVIMPTLMAYKKDTLEKGL